MSHDACMCVTDTSTDRARGNIHAHFRSLSLYRKERHAHAHTFSRENGHPFCLSLYRKGGAAFNLSFALSQRFSCPLCKAYAKACKHTHTGAEKDRQTDSQVRKTDSQTAELHLETRANKYTHAHAHAHAHTLTHLNTYTKKVCCSVLQRDAACCSDPLCAGVERSGVLLCAAMCGCALQSVPECCSVLQCVAVCCSVLQCVAVCTSVLQYVVVLGLQGTPFT